MQETVQDVQNDPAGAESLKLRKTLFPDSNYQMRLIFTVESIGYKRKNSGVRIQESE